MLVQATDLCYTLNGLTDILVAREEKMLPQIGMPELLVLLVIIIIVFGVGRLPEVGGALGKAIREFRQSSQGLDEEKSQEEKSLQDPEGKEEA